MDVASKARWFRALEKEGEVFFVGGSVRDQFIGKVSKDIDVVVRKIPYQRIIQILSPLGKVIEQEVGGKQPTIKFVPKGETEEIDIALPRTEKKTGEGHKDFEITTDPNLPLYKDLQRRDFTINAIAKDKDGNTYDPFGGQEDLKKKIIRAVNPQAFQEDPLRMLRAIQFASRFGFTIEKDTLKMIRDTKDKLKHITGERVVIELEKILSKGKPEIGAKLLGDTGVFKAYFGFDLKASPKDFKQVKTMGEFIYLLLSDHPEPWTVWSSKLKGDTNTGKEIRALHMANSTQPQGKDMKRMAGSIILATADISRSKIVPRDVQKTFKELKSNKYPIGRQELSVDGRDLMSIGIKGKEIGDTLEELLRLVYADQLINKKDVLMDAAKNV